MLCAVAVVSPAFMEITMRPFYASALIFLTVCSLWIAADAPYSTYRATTPGYDVGFGSITTLRH